MFKKGFFLTLIGLGIFLLVQVVMPLVSFKVWELTHYQQNTTLATATPSTQVLGVSVQDSSSFPVFISTNRRSEPLPYTDFSLSVPTLNIEKATVITETNDFEQNLAHLPGTALPGEKGNVFITGHSSLTQLYKPDNYKAIFANLPKIKKGDTILVDAGGQVFTYQVTSLKIVDPKEVSVVNPPESTGRYLTLMTCVPPGLYLKRLIVLAELK